MSEITIQYGENHVYVMGEDEIVRATHDRHVGDWPITATDQDWDPDDDEPPAFVYQPGGVPSRDAAVEWALYELGVIEETDVQPTEKLT
jgi:hypothetical protein